MTARPSAARLVSLDALRGFTVFVMIFVNDAASVRGLPPWLLHMPPGTSGMTFVDVVFPAFLFMVGTALPFAFERRRREGMTPRAWAAHVLIRALSLVSIGVLVMNGRELDPAAAHVPYAVWNAAMLIAVILAWSQEPPEGGGRWIAVRTLRLVSVAALIVLVAAYRSRTGGGLDLRNWSILGSIGWAYLTASALYGLTRGRVAGLAAALAGLVAWNVSTRLGSDAVTWVARHVPPLGNGGAASIVVAGILAAKVLLANVPLIRRIAFLSSYAAAMIVIGAALAPRFRVAKIGSTPSWCLFSAAITTLLLLAFHLAVDVKGWQRAIAPFLPAGRQALIVYLLPDIFYAVFGLQWLDVYFGVGYIGLVRAAGFAVLVLGAGALVTRHGLRIRL